MQPSDTPSDQSNFPIDNAESELSARSSICFSQDRRPYRRLRIRGSERFRAWVRSRLWRGRCRLAMCRASARSNPRGSQRIVSGLAENTNSILGENLPRPETANGCLVLPSAGTYAESHPVRIDRSEIGLPLATRGPSWQGAWSGHVLDCAPFSPLVARWVRSRGAACHAYKNPDGVNRSVTSGQLRKVHPSS